MRSKPMPAVRSGGFPFLDEERNREGWSGRLDKDAERAVVGRADGKNVVGLRLFLGEMRRDWEHSIPPVSKTRYSLTFRSLRRQSPTQSMSTGTVQ